MEATIFRNASTTYYWSSLFFPASVRADVFKLYSFVRVADDFVDTVPQDEKSFYELKDVWLGKRSAENPLIRQVVENINYLSEKYHFDPAWIEAFLESMEADIRPVPYKTLQDSLHYVYGSADVIGLMMAKILDLPESAMETAGRQGRAMQWINFIRDIDEDNGLGRCYFPREDLIKIGLSDLSCESAEANPKEYKKFIRLQIDRYKQWQQEAEAGYKYIPKRLRIPVRTAAAMYGWTAHEIAKDPFVVFEKKVKPSKFRVAFTALRNCL